MYRKKEWESGSNRFQVVPSDDSFYPEGDFRAGEPASEQPPAEALAPLPSPPPAPAQPNVLKSAPAAKVGNDRPRQRSRRKGAIGAVALVALGAAGWFGYDWWTVWRFTVSTDDAYVQAYNNTVAAKVAGYVASVPVTDNTAVHAGDVIATLDDGDYRLAVDSARAKVETQEATIARINHQVVAQDAIVAQAKAQLASAQAGARRMQLELERQNELVQHLNASRQAQEQAQANRDQGLAAVDGAQAAIDSAVATTEVLKSQQQEAVGTLNELKASLARAERDLAFTVIRAPIDGVIGNRAVQTGDYVQTGQRLASVVPLDDVYVTANFKETQIAHLKPGQPVTIAVDALPEHAIQGTVESFSPASGAVFSLLPPDNATGNFTKIVQRLPVRIHVPAGVAREGLLRPGMSVVVSINTKASALAAAGAPAQSAAAR
jgi:membrane fusion protein, multidrug efflux system